MTDANGMTFTNLTMSKNLCVAGETLTASITVKNNTGVNIPNLTMRMVCRVSDFSGNPEDRNITPVIFAFTSMDSLGKGKTKTYTWTKPILDAPAEYFVQYPQARAVPVYIEYRAMDTENGNFGRSDYRVDGLMILNAYYHPWIDDFKLERCTDGIANDEGENLLSSLRLAIADTAGVPFMGLRLYYADAGLATTDSPYIDLTEKIPDLLAGVTDSADLIRETFSNGSNWDFLLMFGDQYESITAKYTLARAFANLHLSGEVTGGACFGGFSTSTLGNPKLESHYPGFFYAGIHGVTNYSDGEIKTGGRWIDNRPIYRKTVELPPVPKGTTSTAAIVTISQDIGQLIEYYGMVRRNNGVWYPLNYRSISDSALIVECYFRSDGGVAIRTGSNTVLDGGYMICLYTKASDEPVMPDDGTAPLIDADGIAVADAGGTPYFVRAYNADQYISAYTGAQIDTGIARAMEAATQQYVDNAIRNIELTPGVGIVNITLEEITGEYAEFTDKNGNRMVDANGNSFMVEV